MILLSLFLVLTLVFQSVSVCSDCSNLLAVSLMFLPPPNSARALAAAERTSFYLGIQRRYDCYRNSNNRHTYKSTINKKRIYYHQKTYRPLLPLYRSLKPEREHQLQHRVPVPIVVEPLLMLIALFWLDRAVVVPPLYL